MRANCWPNGACGRRIAAVTVSRSGATSRSTSALWSRRRARGPATSFRSEAGTSHLVRGARKWTSPALAGTAGTSECPPQLGIYFFASSARPVRGGPKIDLASPEATSPAFCGNRRNLRVALAAQNFFCSSCAGQALHSLTKTASDALATYSRSHRPRGAGGNAGDGVSSGQPRLTHPCASGVTLPKRSSQRQRCRRQPPNMRKARQAGRSG